MSRVTSACRVVILLPVFNDWPALRLLLERLGATLRRESATVSILVVDDGSTNAGPAAAQEPLPGLQSTRILHLRCNLGHQRATAAGLVYIYQHLDCDAVVVMDADGEDRAEDVPLLLRKFEAAGRTSVVFAARTRRMESRAFRFFYHTYRMLHLLLVGLPVRVGNFSVLPRAALQRLVVSAYLWNHYAAAVVRSRHPFELVPLPRGARLAGTSQMNFAGLVVHGLSALSVFGEIVGARLLAVSAFGLAASCLAILAVVLVRTATTKAIPGWATYSAGIAAVILMQFVMLSFVLILAMLANRTNMSFLPLRDCPYFFGEIETVHPDG